MWWVWVLVALSSLAGLLVLLLSVPIDLSLSMERDERFRSRMRIGWLFGLVGKDLGGGENGKESKEEEEEEEPKKRGRRGKRSPRTFLAAIRTRGFPRHSLRFAGRMLRAIRVRELNLGLQIGLGDPAETGRLLGLLSPVAACVGAIPGVHVSVEPDFYQETFRGYCNGSARIYPIRMVPPIVLFALSLTSFRGVEGNARSTPMMEEVRTGQPVVVGELTITPIENVRVYRGTDGTGSWVYAYKEPVSIIIDSPDGQRTIDLTVHETASES